MTADLSAAFGTVNTLDKPAPFGTAFMAASLNIPAPLAELQASNKIMRAAGNTDVLALGLLPALNGVISFGQDNTPATPAFKPSGNNLQ